MLVLSRKKSEAILIDGVIRIEVVNMAKATVRVRLMAPRSLQLPHGLPRKESRDRLDSPARSSPAGMDVFHLTLVNQQVVPLSDSVNLGVVDADKSRVVFFVDAPLGMSVAAVDQVEPDRANGRSNQILLQFMSQGPGQPEERREQPAAGDSSPTADSDAGRTATDEPGTGTSPDVLPFPSNHAKRHRP